MTHLIKKICYLLFIIVLILPHIQKNFKLIEQKSLKGSFAKKKPKEINLTKNTWHNSSFQKNIEEDLKIINPLRSSAIRLINQFRYSFFNKPSSNGLHISDNGTIMPLDYLESLIGLDLIPVDSIENTSIKAKFIQDSLIRRGKRLLFLIAPGKPSLMQDQIPRFYKTQLDNNNNYKQLLKSFKKHQIDYIDFKQILIEKKESFNYPIFPKFGVHWSGNTISYVTQDLFDYLGKTNPKVDLPKLLISEGDKTKEDYRFTDYDIGESMNLLFFESNETLHYPSVTVQKNKDSKKPRLIAIGDSFFQSFVYFNQSFQESFDNDSKFFFYNETIEWPFNYRDAKVKPEFLNLEKEIEQADLIIIEMTEQNTKYAGYKFIHQLYKLFKKDKALYESKDFIYNELISNSNSLNIDTKAINFLALDQNTIIDNISFNRALKGDESYIKQIDTIIDAMHKNPEWLEKLKKQATDRGISLEKNMLLNAKFVLSQKQKAK